MDQLYSLSIGEVFRLVRYQQDSWLPLPPDDIFLKHLRLYKADFLLWQQAPVEPVELLTMMNPARGKTKFEATLSVLFQFPATNLFRLLRLFKPGRLIAGDTFFLISCEMLRSEKGLWETMVSHRCSEMGF